jgi:hypothetical protein
VRVGRQRVKRTRGQLWLAPIVVGLMTGFGLVGTAATALADQSASSPPDLSHPSRPAVPGDSSPRALAPLAPSGVLAPVVVDPAVSNTEANFAANDTIGGSEPSVALNPANTNQVAITSFSMGNLTWSATQNAPLWYSTDAASTWTKEFTITHPPGRTGEEGEGCPPCDQTIDYGRNGTLFGTFLINVNSKFNQFDVVSGDTTNPAEAAAWQWNGNPVQLTNNAHAGNTDQPWLLVNRDPTEAAQDDVWSAYDDFGKNPTNAQVAFSNNAAPPNFNIDNSPGAMANSGTNPGLRLAKDPRNGWMYALWQTTTGATVPHPTTLHINRSTDGGATWTLNGSTAGQALPEGQADDGCTTVVKEECTAYYKFATVNALLGGVHHAAVDPTNGDVYVVYGNDTAGTGVGNQLFIRRLTDNGSGGFNIGAAVTVSISTSAALPSVAVTSDGTIGVLYDTFENEFSEPPGSFPRMKAHLAVSTDHGATFKDTVLETFLSPSKTEAGNLRQRILGDFQQIKSNRGLLYGVFSGNRVPLNGGEGRSIIDPIYFSAKALPRPTTTKTTLSGEGKTGESITVKEGSAVTDQATISGENASSAEGTVTYKVYSDNQCTKEVASAGEVTVSAGKAPPSEAKTLSPGTYYWQASYSGDETNEKSSSKCGDEVLIVKRTGKCGKTTIGKSTDELIANQKRVNRCAIPVKAEVGELVMYLAPTSHAGSQVIKGVIYEDSKGKPGKLLGTSNELTFTSKTAAGWYPLVFPAPAKLAAGNSWIGVISGKTTKVAGERFDSVKNAEDFNANTYTSGPRNPFGEFKTTNEQMSLYANWTES